MIFADLSKFLILCCVIGCGRFRDAHMSAVGMYLVLLVYAALYIVPGRAKEICVFHVFEKMALDRVAGVGALGRSVWRTTRVCFLFVGLDSS